MSTACVMYSLAFSWRAVFRAKRNAWLAASLKSVPKTMFEHRVAHDGAHTGGVGIAGGAARAHDDEIGLDLAGVAQNFGGRHTHAQFHAEGAGTGFNLIGVGRIEFFAHHLLIRLIRLLKAAAAGIGDVGGEPTGGDAAAMVERQFRLLLFRQPKSQFRGVVAAGRSRTRKQDVLEQHLATP